MEHFWFPGNIEFAGRRWPVFIEGWCVDSSSVKQCLWSVNHEQFPMQMTQNSKHSKWLQILSEDDFPPKGTRTPTWNLSPAETMIKRNRRGAEREHVERQRQNTTITLQTKPMKRGNTDCWCFKKRSVGQATLEVYSQKYLLRCNDRQEELHDLCNALQEYLSNGLRTAIQPLHLEQQWILQKALFYIEQFRTPIMCDM